MIYLKRTQNDIGMEVGGRGRQNIVSSSMCWSMELIPSQAELHSEALIQEKSHKKGII